jgi:hypothetical protein
MKLYLRLHCGVDLLQSDHALHQLGGNSVITVISERGICLVSREAGAMVHDVYHIRFPLMQDEANDLLKISQCVCRVTIRLGNAVDIFIVQPAE